jgi:hypothetical protein
MVYIIVAVLYAASEWKLVPTARIAVVVVQSDCQVVVGGLPKVVTSAESDEPVEGVRV